MVLLLILTQLLEQRPDAELEALADRVVEALVERFWNPEYRLNNESLDHDYRRPDDPNEDFVYLGHAIETLWMLMVEARRRDDAALFELAAARFRRHLEVAWDDVYGGLFRALKVHGAAPVDKVLWAQEEGLIGCMLLCELTDWDWPSEWFGRLFGYVEERFRLRPHGFPLYLTSGDRKVTFPPHVTRKENYHHPRQVMRNLLAVERLLARGGPQAAATRRPDAAR
jgi:mannose/cellobiose epimerase-like protein (N-acyl-D-glucosamine 2-epimerase family)